MADGPNQALLAQDFVDTVDFGVLTAREDELEAMARRCAEKAIRQYYVTGRQGYLLFDVVLGCDLIYRLALVRSVRPGKAEAQHRTSNMIEDFDPTWLMLVGIAGATPSSEFTLGDVVLATELHDFSVQAAVFEKVTEYRPGGGPMAPEVENFIGLLPGRLHDLGNWNEASSIGRTSPPVDVNRPNAIYGDSDWQKKVREAISQHFPTVESTRKPQITTRPFAGGDVLVKDDGLWREWRDHARQIEVVEMELEGVYWAARTRQRTYPILVSKGISDIIGFCRDDVWTGYACETAAAGALATLTLRPIEPKEKPELHANERLTKKAKQNEKTDAKIDQLSRRTKRGGLIHEFYLKRNQLTTIVHGEYSLGLNSTLRTALIGLNELRRTRGLKPYFASTLFRIISEPRISKSGIELNVAPIDFLYRAALEEESVEDAVKEHVRTRVQETAQRISKRLQGTHPTLNGFNYHPLGVEIVLVTHDGKTLLRRRGKSVLVGRSEWDVSYSGYCGADDTLRGGRLDLSLTVQHELQREIGILPADPPCCIAFLRQEAP